jgi:hypothetical protein
MVLSPNQLHASYTDVRQWEGPIDFIDNNWCSKVPYIPTLWFKCTLEQDKLDEEYMGLYTIGQIIMDPIYGQISYHCWLANASNFKLGHYLRICLVEMRRATGKEIAAHVFRPLKIIPASRVKARCAQLLIIIRSD